MAAFNAASIVEDLDYDFTAMAGHPNYIKELAEAKGTIREPTALQVRNYWQASAKEMQRIRREAEKAVAAGNAGGDAPEPPGTEDEPDDEPDGLDLVADADPKAAQAIRGRDAANLSKLCSGDPSTEILLALPHRIYLKFAEWLMKEVTDPEAVTGAGSPPLQIVRSPAAG